jgi:A/G-specific adenine glycosylase
VGVVDRHGGRVPETEVELRALPGVGEYTAAALRAFAFGRRSVVLDTNVRRVLARLVDGAEYPSASLTVAERARAAELMPDDDTGAAHWSVALMELGALVCTARAPRCSVCPVRAECTWLAAGQPAYAGPPRRVQRFAGTDRQVRGRIMAVLRDAEGPVRRSAIEAAWAEPIQRERALDGLVADGLVEPLGESGFSLPNGPPVPTVTAGAGPDGARPPG